MRNADLIYKNKWKDAQTTKLKQVGHRNPDVNFDICERSC